MSSSNKLYKVWPPDEPEGGSVGIIVTFGAGAEIDLAIDVRSSAGISDDSLNKRIVEGLEQLGVTVAWKPNL